MYYLVYFHRISVLTQTYILRAMIRARELTNEGKLQLALPLEQILMNAQLTPAQYCLLTDYPVMSALFEWANHSDLLLSTLCRRVISRSEFHRRITGHPLRIGEARRVLPVLRKKVF